MQIIIPYQDALSRMISIGIEQDDDAKVVKYIDDRMIETPSIALSNTVKETLRMGEKAKESLSAAMDGIMNKSNEKIELSFKKEKNIVIN